MDGNTLIEGAMKKLLRGLGLALTGWLGLSVAVTALSYTYQVPITATENGTQTYEHVSLIASVNNTALQAAGYLNSTGNNTDFSTGYYIISDNRVAFYTPLINQGTTSIYYYYMGADVERSTFSITNGHLGYVTAADNNTTEIGANYSVEASIYVNTDFTFTDNATPLSTALTQSGMGGWNAGQLVDGNTATGGFNTDASPVGSYVLLDFGAGNEVALIRWQYYCNDLKAVFDIQASADNVSWRTIYRDLYCDGATGWKPAAWPNMGKYRYWRSLKTNAAAVGGTCWELYVSSADGGGAIMYHQGSYCLGVTNVNQQIASNMTFAVGGSLAITANNTAAGLIKVTCNVSYIGAFAYASIYINDVLMDGPELIVAANNTAYDWFFMTNSECTPYADNISISVNGTRQLYYAPTSIIDGSTLPDRETTVPNDGTIHWGANPSSINVTVGAVELISASTATGTTIEGSHILPEYNPSPSQVTENSTGNTTGLYGFVSWMNTSTGIAEVIVWYTMAFGTAFVGAVVTCIALLAATRGVLPIQFIFGAAMVVAEVILAVYAYSIGTIESMAVIISGIVGIGLFIAMQSMSTGGRSTYSG